MQIGLNGSDLKRIAWTFIMAAAGVLIALASNWFVNGGELNWKVWAIASVAAGIAAVKNGLLADGSAIK